jgi:3-deoxy-D-manno-octulosonate 8-phosphate phosphatase (KDO 8-P phosphatase)
MNAEKLEHLAKQIKLLVLDVDGVLTDGGLLYDEGGRVLKRFHASDGLGMKMAMSAGLEIGVISGLSSPAVSARMNELGIIDYVGGDTYKLPLLEKLVDRKGVSFQSVAFMGDDWVDAECMRRVGLAMTTADAQPEIKDMAAWTSSRSGGHGAVREAIMFLLKAKGEYEALWRKWS